MKPVGFNGASRPVAGYRPPAVPRFGAMDREDFNMVKGRFQSLESRVGNLDGRMQTMIGLMERMAGSMERTEGILRKYFDPDSQDLMP